MTVAMEASLQVKQQMPCLVTGVRDDGRAWVQTRTGKGFRSWGRDRDDAGVADGDSIVWVTSLGDAGFPTPVSAGVVRPTGTLAWGART